MQIVLLQDVKSLGKKGQIVKVNDGYARNFILPKNLGEEATPANLAKLAGQKKYEEKVAAEQLAAAKELAAKIEKTTIKLTVKVGSDGGKIFGSVTGKEISEAAMQQCGLEIDKKKDSSRRAHKDHGRAYRNGKASQRGQRKARAVG